MAHTMQRSTNQDARGWPWRATIALAAATIAFLGIVAGGGSSLAQTEIVSTETATTLSASTKASVPGTAVTLTARIDAVHAAAARGAVPGGFIDFYDETT